MTDTTLQLFGTEIEKELVQPLQRVLQGRRLVYATDEKGFGVSAVRWSTITQMSDGMVSYAFTKGNEDSLNAEPTTLKVPVYWKDFTIDRREYEAFINGGTDIDTSVALSAAYVAAKVEDSSIIDGVSNDGTHYDVEGLYQGADNDYSTTKGFNTFGNALAAISGGYALLEEDGVPTNIKMNLVLNPVQMNELRVSMSTTGTAEAPMVKDLLNGGEIISSAAQTAGTGLLIPAPEVGKAFVDFYLTKDWDVELAVDPMHPKTGDISGRVYSAGILRIKQATALCKLSDI
jgi:uncharacterized linocin/CFP29 family protein